MAAPGRNNRRADRIRAAICVTLASAGAPMSVSELVAALGRLGLSVGDNPNKTVADAVRWEVARGHVRKVRRGTYAVGRLPRSTRRYMAERVAAYVADPTASYSRPANYPVPAFWREDVDPDR
jgi:hypothetical protein